MKTSIQRLFSACTVLALTMTSLTPAFALGHGDFNAAATRLLTLSLQDAQTTLTPVQALQAIQGNGEISLGAGSKQVTVRRGSNGSILLAVLGTSGQLEDVRAITIAENATAEQVVQNLQITLSTLNLASLNAGTRNIANNDIISPAGSRSVNGLVGLLGVLGVFSGIDMLQKGKLKEGIAVFVACGAVISADYFIFN